MLDYSNLTDEEILLLADASCREYLDIFAERAFGYCNPTDYMGNWHLDAIFEALTNCYTGDIKRLIMNMPPRVLKTYTSSIAFPAWAMGKDPEAKFMLVSFAGERSRDMTMGARAIMRSPWYQRLFPHMQFKADVNRQTKFEFTTGASYYSAPIQSVTGAGSKYLIIDDPINPLESDSDIIRDSTNEKMAMTLFSRADSVKDQRIILVQQRLHKDDPTGYFMDKADWTVLSLPAYFNERKTISIGNRQWVKEAGDLLFPDRLPQTELDKIRKLMGERNYLAQMLQEPITKTGGEFKSNWLRYYNPANVNPKSMNVYITCDPSSGHGKDYTAIMVIGLSMDKNYYVLDMVRDKLNSTARAQKLVDLHMEWAEKLGKPAVVGYEDDTLKNEIESIERLMQSLMYNFTIIPLKADRQKEARIRGLISPMELGQIYFPNQLFYQKVSGENSDLVIEFTNDELLGFPYAGNDDMLDALSMILNPKLGAVFPSISTKATKLNRGSQSWRDW